MESLRSYQEIVVFDCETTGLNPKTNHIIELAACLFVLENNHYVLKDQIDVLIKINYPPPSEITALTGITPKMLEEEGVEESVAVRGFYKRFLTPNHSRKLMAAYNAPFDINFINEMLGRYGKRFSECDFLYILTVYDDRAAFPHKLNDALSHYKLDEQFSNSHRAVDDCLACYEVLVTMGKEKDDLDKYVNLFGYNPKYLPKDQVSGVKYKPQFYNSKSKLYEY